MNSDYRDSRFKNPENQDKYALFGCVVLDTNGHDSRGGITGINNSFECKLLRAEKEDMEHANNVLDKECQGLFVFEVTQLGVLDFIL